MWKGTIAFGLVSIPVALHVAVQEHRVRFNQLEEGTSNRIRYRRVNEETGKEVPLERIVRGAPLGQGRYVVLDDEELAAAAPKQSRTIELLDFVAGEAIDPMQFDTPYYLAPANDAARRPYALLAAALRDAGRVGVASFVLREREHLAAIRTNGPILVLETMRFADEIRQPPAELEGIDELEPRARELEIARSLVDSMASEWEPERYKDAYRERLEAVIDAKARGEQIAVHEPAEPASNVVDLVSVLSRSVEMARGRRAGGAGEERGANEDGAGAAAGPETADGRGGPRGGDAEARPGGPDELSQMTRSELYRLAKEHDIAGRSSMDREALISALREVTGRPRPARRRRAS